MSKKIKSQKRSQTTTVEQEIPVSAREGIAELKDSYDNMIYKSKSFTATSVTSLEAKARIWGLNPVSAEKARVLELGCSMGGNIIGQAAYFPKGSYVGIDLSSTQIDVGNQIISFMGLKNIRLEEKNIMDIDASFGTFDYIIVHGIWSWVPDVVKEKILDICSVNLSKRGIAYISYNTYPGWKRLSQIRDMMYFSVRHDEHLNLEERTTKGMEVCQTLANIMEQTVSVKDAAQWKINNIRSVMDHEKYYIAHEYFETFNDPVYVHEFIDKAEAHGLCHIADTEFTQSCITWLRPEIKETLEKLSNGDNTAKEQYIDYYYDTQFRRSMLCHKSQEKHIHRKEEIQLDALNSVFYTYSVGKTPLRDVEGNPTEQGIVNICRRQKPFSVADIIEEVERLVDGKEYDKLAIYRTLLRFLFAGLIQTVSVKQEKNIFLDGISTVPKALADYVETVVLKGGDKFITVANIYNERITGLDVGHIFVMRQLETPKSITELKAAVNEGLVVTRTLEDGSKETILGETKLDAILFDLGNLGFLKN